VGGFHATSEFENFSNGSTERGLSGFYALVDHELLSAEADALGMSLFLRGAITPDTDLATVGASIEAGVRLSELLFRDDALGIGVVYTDFSDDYLTATRESGDDVTSSETVFELTYQVLVTDWFAVQPDLQYILDPHLSRDNALVVGVRAEVLF
tara:strand:+ start:11954 stop:12415 length:462 start_codon:yes stop_codon:yes gene_type:complete